MTPSSSIQTESLLNARDFVAHWQEIEALRKALRVESDVLLNPLHFLTATDHARHSCSVVCWRGETLIGLLYATQHYVHGVPSGYAIGGDYAGRGLVVCREEDEAAVIRASIEELVRRGVHSLHLRLLPRDYSRVVVPGMEMRYLDAVIVGDRLPLPSSFEGFLGQLGKHTRRNVRNSMRKAQAAGIEFVPHLTEQEYRAGVDRLNANATFRMNSPHRLRDERLLAIHSGSQRLGLRARDGTLAAMLCGFTQAGRFHVLRQVNHAGFESLSLSLVLRGHMAAHLIGSGHTEIQFLGGTSLTLGRFCVPHTYRSIFADKTTGAPAALKHLGRGLVRVMERMGRRVPEGLSLACNGRLEESRLAARTALGPSNIVFQEMQSSHDLAQDEPRGVAKAHSSTYSVASSAPSREAELPPLAKDLEEDDR